MTDQEKLIDISVSMSPEVAYELAQFMKRLGFDDFLDKTEAHLSNEVRKSKAHQMSTGIEALRAALAQAGISPL